VWEAVWDITVDCVCLCWLALPGRAWMFVRKVSDLVWHCFRQRAKCDGMCGLRWHNVEFSFFELGKGRHAERCVVVCLVRMGSCQGQH